MKVDLTGGQKVVIKLSGRGWDATPGLHRGQVVDAVRVANSYYFPVDEPNFVAQAARTSDFHAKVVDFESEEATPSPVVHPAHYNDAKGMPEVWDILDAFFPSNPTMWNAGKYLLRYDRKGDPAEQLRKLSQYVNRELEKIDAGKD